MTHRILLLASLAAVVSASSCARATDSESTATAVAKDADATASLVRFSPDVALRGDGSEREHVYYRAKNSDWVSAGVWEAEPYESGPDTPVYSEFMLLLEGSVTLVDAAGREETFRAGDAILIPRGVTHRWKQPGFLKKFWVIFDEGPAGDWQDRTELDTFVRFEPHGPEGRLTEEGRTREHTYYAARGEKLSAGVWEADPSTTDDVFTPNYTELMCILEGSVTVIDGAGNEELVRAGDVVLVPKGMSYRWKQ